MGMSSVYGERFTAMKQKMLKEHLACEDRFDLSEEQAAFKANLSSLFEMERRLAEKHPGRLDLLMPIQAEQNRMISELSRLMKTSREVQNAGRVFTNDNLAVLIDKIASLVNYHVTDLSERSVLLSDLEDIVRVFRDDSERGTLITPDQDVMMMDGTVPNDELTEPTNRISHCFDDDGEFDSPTG